MEKQYQLNKEQRSKALIGLTLILVGISSFFILMFSLGLFGSSLDKLSFKSFIKMLAVFLSLYVGFSGIGYVIGGRKKAFVYVGRLVAFFSALYFLSLVLPYIFGNY